MGAADDNQVGFLLMGGFDYLGDHAADHNIDTDFHSLFKQIFGPVDKPDIGRFPQANLFFFQVPGSAVHGDPVSLDDIHKNHMV